MRAWAGPDDTTALQGLASRLWPLGLHPGGLGWSAAIGQLGDVALAELPEGLAGWAALDDDALTVQVDPRHPDAAAALVAWAVARAPGRDLVCGVTDGDAAVRAALRAAGFVPAPDAPAPVGMVRPATPEGASLPAGYRIRPVAPGETQARVDCHRAAWRPADLPFAPELAARTPADAQSRFSPRLDEQVRRTWLYDPALDLVVEAPDATLAGCCLVWFDPATGWAEIEPLGIVPAHRNRGLAGALCLDAAARVHARGGRGLFIHNGPRADYPAPAGAYAKVGFEVVVRGAPYRRAAP